MIIKYYTKNVYGKENLYLADRQTDLCWQELSGKKTITMHDMKILSRMFSGTYFEEIIQPK